jgi:hypothetical protein
VAPIPDPVHDSGIESGRGEYLAIFTCAPFLGRPVSTEFCLDKECVVNRLVIPWHGALTVHSERVRSVLKLSIRKCDSNSFAGPFLWVTAMPLRPHVKPDEYVILDRVYVDNVWCRVLSDGRGSHQDTDGSWSSGI